MTGLRVIMTAVLQPESPGYAARCPFRSRDLPPVRKIVVVLAALLLLSACTRQKVLNTLTSDDGYNLASNIVFDNATGLQLDVYSPAGVRNAPVVVFFYGGRWSEGDKADYKFVGQALAAKGFVAVLPNYRLYPKVRFPGFLIDSAKAVRWAHDNGAQYGGDPAKIVVLGHSAGAYNAAMLTLNPDYLKQAGGDRAYIRGKIGLAGPYDFLPITDPDLRDLFGPPENYDQTQPVLYPDGKNPPMLLMHGRDDKFVPIRNSESLAARLKSANGPVETVFYPEMSQNKIVETLSTCLQPQADVMLYVNEFVKRVTSGPATGQVQQQAPGGLQTIVPQP